MGTAAERPRAGGRISRAMDEKSLTEADVPSRTLSD